MEAVETFDQILDKVDPETKIADIHRDAIFNCILDIFTGKVYLQYLLNIILNILHSAKPEISIEYESCF